MRYVYDYNIIVRNICLHLAISVFENNVARVNTQIGR